MSRISKLFFVLLTFVLLSCSTALAQDPDAEGCTDSPLITRMSGSTIYTCENKEFDQFTFTVGSKDGEDIEKQLEGEYHNWSYIARETVSELQIFRNIEAALKKATFIIDYSSSPNVITAHKGNTWFTIHTSANTYSQTILVVKEMQQEVTADASSLNDEIGKTGHVAVYGIHFDTGEATILPDSESTLNEIVKLLEQSPDLKLRVEGHTDNVGAAAANQALAEKRAQAVVAWLVAHGISSPRLTAKGFGQTQPVADNSTEDGRAKNRRVELAKF
jgi:OmpA-OmpF porin, OOP family